MVSVKTRGHHLGLHESGVGVAGCYRMMRGCITAGQLPAGHHITGQHQVRHAAGISRVRVVGGGVNNEIHHVQQRAACRGQPVCNGFGVVRPNLEQLGFGLFHLRGQGFGRLAAVTRGFATYQIVGLNGRRAFVNRQNFRVTVILRRTGFFDEAHAAVHLHAK